MKCASCGKEACCLVNPDHQINFALCERCLRDRFIPAKRGFWHMFSSHEIETDDLWQKHVSDGK